MLQIFQLTWEAIGSLLEEQRNEEHEALLVEMIEQISKISIELLECAKHLKRVDSK